MVTAPVPRLELLENQQQVTRVLTTLLCHDADDLPRVDRAGEVVEIDRVPMQVMHNGLVVEAGTYGGQWELEIIRSLRGVHEPQEEKVFDALIRRLAAEGGGAPRMLEFGSFWAYYSMWFVRELAGAAAVALEPDPHNLEVGRRNARANALEERIEFVHGAIGPEPGEQFEIVNESDGKPTVVRQYDIDALLAHRAWDRADLVLVDVQGYETVLLELGRASLAAGRVRFLVVSTHHHAISADPLTHQRVLATIVEAGGHIVAEHTVGESFSGDGLVVASFDPRDDDLVVEISRARARDTIFGDLEWDLERVTRERDEARAEAASFHRRATELHEEATRLHQVATALRVENEELTRRRS